MGGILCDDIIENNETMKISYNLTLVGWHLYERDIILDFLLFYYFKLIVLAIIIHQLKRATH